MLQVKAFRWTIAWLTLSHFPSRNLQLVFRLVLFFSIFNQLPVKWPVIPQTMTKHRGTYNTLLLENSRALRVFHQILPPNRAAEPPFYHRPFSFLFCKKLKVTLPVDLSCLCFFLQILKDMYCFSLKSWSHICYLWAELYIMQIEYINIFWKNRQSLIWMFLKPLHNVETFTEHQSPSNEIH